MRSWRLFDLAFVLCISWTFFLVSTNDLLAAENDKNYKYFGMGTSSCGHWTSLRQQGNFQIGSYLGGEQWVLGFLAGSSNAVAASLKFDFMGKSQADPEAILRSVDKYCQDNSLDTVSEAAKDVFFAIARKADKAKK